MGRTPDVGGLVRDLAPPDRGESPVPVRSAGVVSLQGASAVRTQGRLARSRPSEPANRGAGEAGEGERGRGEGNPLRRVARGLSGSQARLTISWASGSLESSTVGGGLLVAPLGPDKDMRGAGDPFTDRKSTFQAHLADVRSEEDILQGQGAPDRPELEQQGVH
eukprot:756752-Hanusia_phi.AAC.2